MHKLIRETDLAGKTLRGVWDAEYGYNLVLVFEDDDWAVFQVNDGGTDDASVGLERTCSGPHGDIRQYLSADDLLEARLLTQEQHRYLVAHQTAEKAEQLRKEAERLMKEAATLSGEVAA